MPLVGGGGAPNVAGSNPSGVGTSVNYLRTPEATFAYAYSGEFTTDTSDQTLLDFTTGSEVIVGTLQFTGPISKATAQNGRISTCVISMDSQVIGLIKSDTTDDFEGTTPNWIKVVIPPYTRVTMTCDSNSADADFFTSGLLTGRVYA